MKALLHDLLGRVHAEDIRENTVANLASRYHVDTIQADRVARTAIRLLEQASTGWRFQQMDAPRTLGWGAMLHEIGMDIAHSQYHKHGGYLLEHLDMPGFSRQDQHHLAMIVRAHRRKFPIELLRDTPELMRLCVLMRLAVVFHRSRATLPAPVHLPFCAPERHQADAPQTLDGRAPADRARHPAGGGVSQRHPPRAPLWLAVTALAGQVFCLSEPRGGEWTGSWKRRAVCLSGAICLSGRGRLRSVCLSG